MIFNETGLPGAFVIDIEPIRDQRGFFARAWCRKEFEQRGLTTEMAQANLSSNPRKGTLRGMHYQIAPHQEVKLVRCIKGSLFDVIIDLRPQSATYGEWFGVELSAENRKVLYVPKGFAHGFQTLEDDTEALYQVSEFYHPQSERGIRWNDPVFEIDWPFVKERIISEKDANWPDFGPTNHTNHTNNRGQSLVEGYS